MTSSVSEQAKIHRCIIPMKCSMHMCRNVNNNILIIKMFPLPAGGYKSPPKGFFDNFKKNKLETLNFAQCSFKNIHVGGMIKFSISQNLGGRGANLGKCWKNVKSIRFLIFSGTL